MNKLVLALALVLSFHGLKAHADKLEDLGTEVEAEEMESFDQKAMEDAQRKETAQNEQKTRDLEKQIDRLKAENRSISKRVESQTDRFNRVYKQARETEALAKKFEAQRNQTKAQLDAARSRTQQAQNRLQSATELKKSLTREIAQQERETRSLKQKL
jgi:chromosome segregation ATPase